MFVIFYFPSNAFDPGDKVTFNGKHYYCRPCADKLGAQSPGSPGKSPDSPVAPVFTEHVSRAPVRTSTPMKKVENGSVTNDRK